MLAPLAQLVLGNSLVIGIHIKFQYDVIRNLIRHHVIHSIIHNFNLNFNLTSSTTDRDIILSSKLQYWNVAVLMW